MIKKVICLVAIALSFCDMVNPQSFVGKIKRIKIRKRRVSSGFRIVGKNNNGDSITIGDGLSYQIVIFPDNDQTPEDVNTVYILSDSKGTDSLLWPKCSLFGSDTLNKYPAEIVDGTYVITANGPIENCPQVGETVSILVLYKGKDDDIKTPTNFGWLEITRGNTLPFIGIKISPFLLSTIFGMVVLSFLLNAFYLCCKSWNKKTDKYSKVVVDDINEVSQMLDDDNDMEYLTEIAV